MSQYLGDISAYALAVSQGYTGTEEEYAELMASYATVGQTAVTAAQTATTKASEAATSATTATNKASEATTAATTATTKAAEAQADADAAALDASQALSAASTATTKATEATTAAATATSAKTDAVAANTAAQSAKTAAQTAQTGAETAAASVEASAEQIATNASDIDQLKSKFTALEEDLGGYVDKVEAVTLDNTFRYYVNGRGEITSTGGNYAIRKGYVTEGQKYLITASANWNSPYYAWYDANDTLVELGTLSAEGRNYTSITDEVAVAPTGASYIIINWNTASVKGFLKLDKGKQLAQKWYGKKWVCVGDSLTATNQYAEKHYFDYIADATDITVVNMGDSGTGYARAQDTDRAFYQRISACPTDADVVTIFGSFNDLGAGLPTGSYTDTGTTTVAGCINATIDALQAVIPDAILGIVAPTPWQSTQPTPNSAGDLYVNMLKSICEHRSIPFLDLYRESNLRPWDSDFRALCYSNDGGNGTHPNELGHKIIAPKFKAFLETLLM